VSEIQPGPLNDGCDLSNSHRRARPHARKMMYVLLDFAMRAGVIERARNAMELVIVNRFWASRDFAAEQGDPAEIHTRNELL
jgi:hypothetical protein